MLDNDPDHDRPEAIAPLILATPSAYALFVDFDGTLADIAPSPELVKVEPGLPQDIIRLQGLLGGAVAVVTGRRISEVNRHLAPAQLPGSGLHGLEFRSAPFGAEETTGHAEQIGIGLPPALFDAVVALTRAMTGVWLENKGPILSIHYRQAPEFASELGIKLARLLNEQSFGFHVKQGRAVFELIPNGTSKGTALAEIMRHAPFAGRRPIMIGDDLADEEAFAVARAADGWGLTVRGEHFHAGDESFGSASEVRRWLSALAGVAATSDGQTAAATEAGI